MMRFSMTWLETPKVRAIEFDMYSLAASPVSSHFKVGVVPGKPVAKRLVGEGCRWRNTHFNT